jgi:NurA-like 5'-3' nuclease
LYERKNRGKTMANIKIEEATKQVEKKLVALEMSKDMWKQVRLEAVDNDLSFSAMVRVIISKYLRESGAKLNSTVKEEELQDGKL